MVDAVVDAVSKLIKAVVNTNAADANGHTALHYAAESVGRIHKSLGAETCLTGGCPVCVFGLDL